MTIKYQGDNIGTTNKDTYDKRIPKAIFFPIVVVKLEQKIPLI